MSPGDTDLVFGRARVQMVTGQHVACFREAAQPGRRRRYTKRFLETAAGDFRAWTGRERRVIEALGSRPGVSVAKLVSSPPATGATELRTYDAGPTVDQWATRVVLRRGDATLGNVFEECHYWWSLARQCLVELDALHALGFAHLDLKADNLCLPWAPSADYPEPGQALALRFERLAVIDVAFSLLPGIELTEPLPLAAHPDYEYQSPRLLEALEAGRVGDVAPARRLDWRCDFFSLAALLWSFLPERERAARCGWTVERLARATAFVSRLVDVDLGELPARRPHAELVALAEERLRDPEVKAVARAGLVFDSELSIVLGAQPTPRTCIVGSGGVSGGPVAAAIDGQPARQEAATAHPGPGAGADPRAVAARAAAPERSRAGHATRSARLPEPAPREPTLEPLREPTQEPMREQTQEPMRGPGIGAGEPGLEPTLSPALALAGAGRSTGPAAPALDLPRAPRPPQPSRVPTVAAVTGLLLVAAVVWTKWDRAVDEPVRHTVSPAPLPAPSPAPAPAPAAAAARPREPAAATRTPAPEPRLDAAAPVDVQPAPVVGVVTLPSSAESGDYGAVARELVYRQLPGIAARAERQLEPVLLLAGAGAVPAPATAVRAAARDARAAGGPSTLDVAVQPQEARVLNQGARVAFDRGNRLGDAIRLQTRAFGANPLDPEVVGNLAYFLLRASPPDAESARQLALHALTLKDPRFPSGRVEDWTTLAIASALTGREADARNAWNVTLALSGDLQRHCSAAARAPAIYGNTLRPSVEALFERAARSPGYRACAVASKRPRTEADSYESPSFFTQR